MKHEFKLPAVEEILFLLLGILAEKEGIIKKDSTWINYVWDRISEMDEQITEVAIRGAQLLEEEATK
ncbi:MAG TPA: hypothetical protein PLL58_01945 [Candidatus Syntrophosphaera sp.]|jgi:hypothetical protein|nr:hypothetical protein [Candidatus Cloacimonadota bacterium]HQP26564.1 hypothetical protein [Candidatus Syntrophosphaera sp.]